MSEHPTKAELTKLPHRAITAFAVLGSLWPDVPPDWYSEALSRWETTLKEVGLDAVETE